MRSIAGDVVLEIDEYLGCFSEGYRLAYGSSAGNVGNETGQAEPEQTAAGSDFQNVPQGEGSG
jgi:hypothetical protein